MSRSMRSFVTGKTINKQVQFNNRLTTFTNPPITTGDLYVTRDLYVARNTHLNNLDICGNLTVYGDTYLNNLDVSANVDISGNLTIQKNVFSYGTMYAQQYLPGQIVNVSMLNNTQLGQISNLNHPTVTANTTGNVFTYKYSPKIATSYIIIEYQTIYHLIGSNSDSIYAGLQVSEVTEANYQLIATTRQQWNESGGGGTRSGTIFPIVGRYTNETTADKYIRVYITNNTDGDTITVYGDNSTWLKITEIGREI